jgi:hypothetical protein
MLRDWRASRVLSLALSNELIHYFHVDSGQCWVLRVASDFVADLLLECPLSHLIR